MEQEDRTETVKPLPVGARELVAASRQGVLSSLTKDGFPYGSFVEFAPLPDGDLVMFLSKLAEHQRYITADPRASLFISPSMDSGNPLSQQRVTVVGRISLVADRQSMIPLYLAAHPQSQAYINFGDFQFYRLHVERARYIAGFGRMGWILEKSYRAVTL